MAEEGIGKKSGSIVPVEAALAERKTELAVVKNELVEVKVQIKKISKNIDQAKILATPPWQRSIDEVKRRSALPKHMRAGADTRYQDAFLAWLNELEIESAALGRKEAELFKRLDDLREQVGVLSKVGEDLTPGKAYRLLRSEARKHGMKIPYRMSVDGAKRAYRQIAKMYHPDSYGSYTRLTGLKSREEAEERFKDTIITLGICYKKVCEAYDSRNHYIKGKSYSTSRGKTMREKQAHTSRVVAYVKPKKVMTTCTVPYDHCAVRGKQWATSTEETYSPDEERVLKRLREMENEGCIELKVLDLNDSRTMVLARLKGIKTPSIRVIHKDKIPDTISLIENLSSGDLEWVLARKQTAWPPVRARESTRYLKWIPAKFVTMLGLAFLTLLLIFRLIESRAASYTEIHDTLWFYVFLLSLLPSISGLISILEYYFERRISETMLFRYLRKLGVHVD